MTDTQNRPSWQREMYVMLNIHTECFSGDCKGVVDNEWMDFNMRQGFRSQADSTETHSGSSEFLSPSLTPDGWMDS